MRFVVIARASALIACGALLSACPKKDADVVPEPAAPATALQPTGASDKAGAEAPAAVPAAAAPAATPAATPAAAAPAPAKKKKEDSGGW
ncbi:MAG TPA: hypothetical protein VHW01_15020 [Polyangiaceae bacterium]|jgi:hypothetical protein|nr:hypothetical protein [Polyangiaceae bacterium]